MKIARDLMGAAGVHHVVCELSLRGMIALPTIRNTPGYDVMASSRDGERHANIQVKTSQDSQCKWWLTPSADKIRSGRHDYYVLLRLLGRDAGETYRFEGYMLTGKEALAAVRLTEKGHKLAGLGSPPGIFIVKDNERLARRWHKRWQTWTLNRDSG